jgi:hypothetical protein
VTTNGGVMKGRNLFVIGSPRSGTTLLMRMLNVHPEILSRPEPHLLTPLASLGYYKTVDKASYDPFQAQLAVRGFVADLPGGEETYVRALRAYTDTMYGEMLADTDKTVFLDKTPAYALELPFLAKLYPDAIFVVLTRHPFAIFSSFAKSFFDDDWPAAHTFNPVVERYLPAIATFLRDPPAGNTVHVRYEDLVADPHAQLRRICATANLDYTADMVEYGEVTVEAGGLGDPIGVNKATRPNTASVNKWAHAVAHNNARTTLLHKMVASISDEDLSTWGYDRESLWAPVAEVDDATAMRAQNKARKWDRYSVERRTLLFLRRNIHKNLLGRVLKRLRFILDVLLRE